MAARPQNIKRHSVSPSLRNFWTLSLELAVLDLRGLLRGIVATVPPGDRTPVFFNRSCLPGVMPESSSLVGRTSAQHAYVTSGVPPNKFACCGNTMCYAYLRKSFVPPSFGFGAAFLLRSPSWTGLSVAFSISNKKPRGAPTGRASLLFSARTFSLHRAGFAAGLYEGGGSGGGGGGGPPLATTGAADFGCGRAAVNGCLPTVHSLCPVSNADEAGSGAG